MIISGILISTFLVNTNLSVFSRIFTTSKKFYRCNKMNLVEKLLKILTLFRRVWGWVIYKKIADPYI